MRAHLSPSAPILRLAAVTLVAWAAPLSAQGTEPSDGAIDAQVWSVVSTTVVEHDIAGMAAAYHADAVVVTPQGTMPVARALARLSSSSSTLRSLSSTDWKSMRPAL